MSFKKHFIEYTIFFKNLEERIQNKDKLIDQILSIYLHQNQGPPVKTIEVDDKRNKLKRFRDIKKAKSLMITHLFQENRTVVTQKFKCNVFWKIF